MEVVGGLVLLGVIFLLVGGVEQHDSKTELGKEIIAEAEGVDKVVKQNSSTIFVVGGLAIIVLTVIMISL